MRNYFLHSTRCIGLLLCQLFLSGFESKGQYLKRNDTFPDLCVRHVLNYKDSVFRFRDFDNKAVIIYFFNSGCSATNKTMEKLKHLQERYQNELQILLVTQQKKEAIATYLNNHGKINLTHVPIITEGSSISQYFPEAGYPYTIWTNKKRIIQYITHGYNVDDKYIPDFLRGEDLPLKDATIKVITASLWKQSPEAYAHQLHYYSYLTRCINGVDIGSKRIIPTNEGKDVLLSCNCYSITDLYKLAYSEGDKYRFNNKYNTELNVQQKEAYLKPSGDLDYQLWKDRFGYNYELLLPREKKEDAFKKMQEDLKHYFSISVKRTRKKIDGYALVFVGKQPPIDTKAQAHDGYDDFINDTAQILHFRHQPMLRISYLLNFWLEYNYPFKDLTGHKEKIDLDIRKSSVKPLNIDALRQDLKHYGFDLRKTKITVDVLVIKE